MIIGGHELPDKCPDNCPGCLSKKDHGVCLYRRNINSLLTSWATYIGKQHNPVGILHEKK